MARRLNAQGPLRCGSGVEKSTLVERYLPDEVNVLLQAGGENTAHTRTDW
jgi:hypothetical protein